MSRIWTVILAVVALASIGGNILAYYRYSSSRPLVHFGNVVITKKQYMDKIEVQYGKMVLNKMLYAKLVTDAAEKVHLMPPTEEVEARLAEIERRTPQVTAAARQDQFKLAQLKEDLKTDIALENLRMRGVTATDAEVEDFYNKHKNSFILPPQMDTTMVLASSQIDADTATSMLKEGLQPDVIARQPRLKVLGVNANVDLRAIPAPTNRAISQAISKMKLNEVKSIKFSDAFLVVKVVKQEKGGLPPLSKVHDQVLRNVRLAKAPAMGAVLARLYKDANPRFDNEKYRLYFTDVENYNNKK
jgi:hypothetical protein